MAVLPFRRWIEACLTIPVYFTKLQIHHVRKPLRKGKNKGHSAAFLRGVFGQSARFVIELVKTGAFMRAYAVLTGILGFAISGTALAQQTMQTNSPNAYYAAPLYNAPMQTPYYAPSQAGGVPTYNNLAQPVPVEQLIAGKNAPSYNFNTGTQAYTGFGNNPLSNITSIGSLTPEQSRYMQAQADAAAAQRQNEYMASLQQQPNAQQQGIASALPTQFSSGFNNPFGTQPEKPVKVTRRVVYRERNDPLVTPPRLFNPDQ
jgi:uncharacterized iron-regulated membrane protein